jgi:hypothetical protein
MNAEFLQLRVSLSYHAAGDLMHAIVEDLLARPRPKEPAPYWHWFPTQVSDECDLWWALGTTEVIDTLEKTDGIFRGSLLPTLDALGNTLHVARFVVYAKGDRAAADHWGW